MCLSFCFFKQKTAYEMRISDWSSDVCSSDLVGGKSFARRFRTAFSRRSRRRIGGATCDTETGDGRERHCARDGAEEALVLGDHILSPLLMRFARRPAAHHC